MLMLLLVGLAERRERRRAAEGVGGANTGWDTLRASNLGGAEMILPGEPAGVAVLIGAGSSSARIQGAILYSSARIRACSGGIQTLPAVSS